MKSIHPAARTLAVACFNTEGLKPNTLQFVQYCFPEGYDLVAFRGSQFYPLPRGPSRGMCALFPAAAAFTFFLFVKRRRYSRGFLENPVKAHLETNFFSAEAS